jgi:tetratricopeptide (TPR) repeat protein
LLALTVAVYLPILRNGFVDYDDNVYVFGNSEVQAGLTWEGVRWAFSTLSGGNWHPLTWLSHMADCQLFGLRAAGHHATSLLLHAVNTGLLYLVFRRMTGAVGRSAMVAALFALHPLHVESVAWVAERKDVLSTLFWLLALLAYAWYVRSPSWQRYAAVSVSLGLGLMCKPMLVTLPCVLLLLDWWPLGRYAGVSSGRAWWRRLAALTAEKVPLFAMVAALSIVTVIAQSRAGAVVSQEVITPGWRVANAMEAYTAYLEKTLWPAGLAVIYPHPGKTPVEEIIWSVVVLAAITLGIVRFRRRSYAVVGWLWYLGTLVPVIGLVQVGEAAMADRYTYVPLIGVFLALVWGVADGVEWALARLGRPTWHRSVLAAGAAITMVASGTLTLLQERHWRDTETLFRQAVRVTRNNHAAHSALGVGLDQKGDFAGAQEQFREALRLKPDYAEAHNFMGASLGRQGRLMEAETEFREALRLKPGLSEAHNNLGVVFGRQGKVAEALEQFREAVRLKPDYADARNNLRAELEAAGETAVRPGTP